MAEIQHIYFSEPGWSFKMICSHSNERLVSKKKLRWRVSNPIFGLTLKSLYFLTGDTRSNPFVLLKCLTQKVYDDSMSADSVPTCGDKELMKIETSNAIGFRYRHAEVARLASFDVKLKSLYARFFSDIFCREFFLKIIFFFKKMVHP